MALAFEFAGLKLEIPERVYIPSDDSYLLIENLKVTPDDLVLEIGTGSGIVALFAALTARRVIATDISPIAVNCAKNNVIRNHLESKIEVRLGNLFDPLNKDESFDIILFNAPYLPRDDSSSENDAELLQKAWNGGRSGRSLIDPFIRQCKTHLAPSGRVQLVQSTLELSP